MKFLPLLLVAITTSPAWSQPTAPVSAPVAATPWKMAEADKQQWLKEFNTVMFRREWKITIENNDFIIESREPIPLSQSIPGLSFSDQGPDSISYEGMVRVTVRFSPRLAVSDWKQIAAENEVNANAHRKLLGKYRFVGKFDQLSMLNKTPEKVEAYRAEAQKLKHTLLPQCFGLENSATLFTSLVMLSRVDISKEGGEEARDDIASIRRLFGSYDLYGAMEEWAAYPEKYRIQPHYPIEFS